MLEMSKINLKVPDREVLDTRMGRKCQMEQQFSGPTSPTEPTGPPRKVDPFFRNFRKFWFNGSHPQSPTAVGTKVGQFTLQVCGNSAPWDSRQIYNYFDCEGQADGTQFTTTLGAFPCAKSCRPCGLLNDRNVVAQARNFGAPGDRAPVRQQSCLTSSS